MDTTAEPKPIVDRSCDCAKCEARTDRMYQLNAGCLNCGTQFVVRCRFGDKRPLTVPCPWCGVNSSPSWKQGG